MREYRQYPPSIIMSDYTSKHVMAMIVEDLHSKADIAKELAYRDEQISTLRTALVTAEKERDEAVARAAGLEVQVEMRKTRMEQLRNHLNASCDMERRLETQLQTAREALEKERDEAVAGELDAYEQKATLHREYTAQLQTAREALEPFARVDVEGIERLPSPRQDIFLWKPTSNVRDTDGISLQHILDARAALASLPAPVENVEVGNG